jgi:hypothetical protein
MSKQVSAERFWCSELVDVVRRNRNGGPEFITGNLEEIGERMAVVMTEAEVPAGSRVHIACKKHVLKGIVKHCSFDRALGYLVEVRLLPASHWSRNWFSPQHLLPVPQQQLRLSA